MDRGTWWAMVYRVAKSQGWMKYLSTHSELEKKIISTQNLQIHSLELSLVVVKWGSKGILSTFSPELLCFWLFLKYDKLILIMFSLQCRSSLLYKIKKPWQIHYLAFWRTLPLSQTYFRQLERKETHGNQVTASDIETMRPNPEDVHSYSQKADLWFV